MQIDRIGPHFRTVLVQGEMGTGKELVARALLARSRHPAKPFFLCHGAALAETIDDERHGIAGSPWQTLRAGQSGKVLLDSVDEMSLEAQARLLELISNRTSGFASTKMVATAVQSLKKMVAAGRFRSDLYHRLATIEIFIEPLRRRREDIPSLARHLIDRYAALYDKGTIRIADDVLHRLVEHDWPGNVRELENVLRNSVLECDEGIIESQHLGSLVTLSRPSCDTDVAEEPKGNVKLQDIVEQHVLHVLQTCSGNKVRAAEMLGISRSTLYRILGSSLASETWQQI
jgi:DNA-binding NtrC family response regulator